MYHLELRQFPHNAWRFNLSDDQLHAIVEPWAREQIVEIGERKWSPQQAKITILEGPQLDIAQLSMGRGWRAAQRSSENVTERVLAAARQASSSAALAPAATHASSTDAGPIADPLALGVLDDLRSVAALLGSEPTVLLDAWRVAAASSPGLAPSQSLAQAEQAVRGAGGGQR
jgi:hypothetical protein